MNNTPTIAATFLCVIIFLIFTASETREILYSQYSNQAVLVSSPKRATYGANCGFSMQGDVPEATKSGLVVRLD